jgi:nitrogen fixation NifU-like protein
MYTEKVMDHFQNPRNVGEMEDADAMGEVGNVSCGDIMRMYLKIDENDVIEDVKFKTFGCAAAIATSSVMTELIKGKTIEEALKISKNDISEELGGLPPVKVHCSILATEAFEEAVKNYREKQGA